jgi:hypothetical protein
MKCKFVISNRLKKPFIPIYTCSHAKNDTEEEDKVRKKNHEIIRMILEKYFKTHKTAKIITRKHRKKEYIFFLAGRNI